MAIIFDPEIELQLLESQPEWVGINTKIELLAKDLNYWNTKFDKDPQEWIVKKLAVIQEEINFFENILLFWAANYNKLKKVSDAFAKQASVINQGAKLYDLIEDMRIANTHDQKLELVLAETFIKLAESKGMDTKQMDIVLHDLRATVRDYRKMIFEKIDKLTNE